MAGGGLPPGGTPGEKGEKEEQQRQQTEKLSTGGRHVECPAGFFFVY